MAVEHGAVSGEETVVRECVAVEVRDRELVVAGTPGEESVVALRMTSNNNERMSSDPNVVSALKTSFSLRASGSDLNLYRSRLIRCALTNICAPLV